MGVVKKEQIVWLLFATIFMSGFIYVIKDSSVLLATSITYVGIIGAFLGLDLKNMIQKTNEKPEGYYEPMNKHRYILSLVFFGFLLGEGFVMSKMFEKNCDMLYGSFGVGFLMIIGMIVGGIEGNKIATGTLPSKSPDNQIPGPNVK